MSTMVTRKPPQAPPLFNATAESALATIKDVIQSHRATIDKIVAEVHVKDATFQNVMLPILRSDNEADTKKWVNGFYQLAADDEALRDASRQIEEMIDEFDIECDTREDIFALINAAYEQRHTENLDGESLHLLEKERSKFVRNGMLLPPGPNRQRLKEVKAEISKLCSQSQKLLDDETGGVWFTPEELEGIPSSSIEIEALEKGLGENKGKVKVTFKYDHFGPLIRYAANEATRRDYIIAETNRANENIPLFKSIIELRDEVARLAGFPNHASLQIGGRMAKTPARVNEMLADLRNRTEKGAKADLDALLAYKKADYEQRSIPFDGRLYLWDKAYYSRIRMEKEFNFDGTAFSQYFPAMDTFNKMLKVFEEVMGFKFIHLSEDDRAQISPTGKSQDLAWHPDAEIYSVWNSEDLGGEFRGYLYLDLYPRDNKYSEDMSLTLQSGFIKDDGTEFYPSAVLICNLPTATATRPALLEHEDVVTIFHELGHAIHDLAGKSKYARSRSVVWDFLETPSQMLEHWCWTPSVLKSLSSHWETGEQIPDKMVEALLSTRGMNAAIDVRDSLLRPLFDMAIHDVATAEEVKAIDYCTLFNQLRHDIRLTAGPEDIGMGMDWGHEYLTIDHYITGYDAGYYSYLWSNVYSTDMFYTKFKADPMNKEQGRRYRRIVLERGGSMDEYEYLVEFLGREPNQNAFLESKGLHTLE